MKTASTVILILIFNALFASNLPEKHGAIDVQLFVGKNVNQPLVVGFGGSEGGNAWASDHWQATRDEFLNKGYAFLAIGYFGMPNTTQQLDRISLNAIYKAIVKAGENPQVNAKKIALIGGSKGAELVLNLASRYPAITSVVAIVPSHVSFPGLTYTMDHSSWTFNGEEVPYVPANERIIPAVMKRDLHTAFSIMLEDKDWVKKARIAVEKINGSVLIISAREDEMWPSLLMSEQLVEHLEQAKFLHHFEHIVAEGDHASSLNHFPAVFAFLEKYFKTL
ncbi:hypothetical protein MNBD_GAMMA02-225 [hydrothermal vent metagenome]|uniref:BAAT/Acyl-CoA thioester hydrolase C-terminal domain-containing protein n=1 Tax=hydrothermal vent metagenome TaxID=652676 RepID=A0A3B0VSX5_9ZZZZ